MVISRIQNINGGVQVTFANKQGVFFKDHAEVTAIAADVLSRMSPGEKAALLLVATAKPLDLIGVDVSTRIKQVLGV